MTYIDRDPKMTYSDPKVTYSDPKVTHSDPTHLPLSPLASPVQDQAISQVYWDFRVGAGGWVGGNQLYCKL